MPKPEVGSEPPMVLGMDSRATTVRCWISIDKPIAENRSSSRGEEHRFRRRSELEIAFGTPILGKMHAPTMNLVNISHRGEKLWKQTRRSLPSRLRIVDGDW
jgi:hypothetical protein